MSAYSITSRHFSSSLRTREGPGQEQIYLNRLSRCTRWFTVKALLRRERRTRRVFAEINCPFQVRANCLITIIRVFLHQVCGWLNNCDLLKLHGNDVILQILHKYTSNLIIVTIIGTANWKTIWKYKSKTIILFLINFQSNNSCHK